MSTMFITGSSAGLGRAIAEIYAADGYKVGLIARDEEALAKAAGEIGRGTVWAVADVSDAQQLQTAAKKLEMAIGAPDVWINNAMATIFSRFEDIKPEEFAQASHITFLGSMYGIQIALASMKPRKRGHIIQIGSALAYRAVPLQAPYCASKAAIREGINSLRCELINDKSPIRITMVHMPAMNTPQFDWARRHIAEYPQPVPPIYSPQACAEAVLWTAKHPGRREVWVGKPTFEAILGNKLMPALMDIYMARHAFKAQYEKPAQEKNTDGNLFAPVKGFHKAEGHFGDRQLNKVFWMGTSWWQEIIFLIGAFLFLIALIAI